MSEFENEAGEDFDEIFDAEAAPMPAASEGGPQITDVYAPSTVLAAIDQIDDLLESGRTVPMTASVLVNKAQIQDLLTQARESLPGDVATADAVIADADALMARADEVAESTVAEANARAQGIVEDAQRQADELAEQARADFARRQEEAQERAQAIVAAAHEKAEHMISEQEISRQARERAQEIVNAAHQSAIEHADGADQYCQDALENLHRKLISLTEVTENGLATIDRRRRERYGEDQ